MTDLEARIGYEFKDKELLKTALSHSSYANERRKSGVECNERLEFLGDSVLGFVVAENLYKFKSNMLEGSMTKLRADLVCEENLGRVAEKLNLGESLLLGRGEEQCGGRERRSILADAVEAVLAAVYLDGGIEPAAKIIEKYILAPVRDGAVIKNKDYKTLLQEFVQKKSGRQISYRLISEKGPDHRKEFEIEVCLNGEQVGTGIGYNKKEAEQAAAKQALEVLSK